MQWPLVRILFVFLPIFCIAGEARYLKAILVVLTCDGQKDVINLFSLSISPLAQSSKPGI